MEFRRFATVFKVPEDCDSPSTYASQLEQDAMWGLCKDIAAKALESKDSKIITSAVTREIIILIREAKGEAEGKLLNRMMYMNVQQSSLDGTVKTILHVERIESSALGVQCLSRVLLGQDALWGVVPVRGDSMEKIQEKILAFLMCLHQRLGNDCCSWLRATDPALLEESLYGMLKEDLLEFKQVTALLTAECST
jgi:hypothetical protein